MSRTAVVKVVRQRVRTAPVVLPAPAPAPRYLTIEQACEWLGVSDTTLRVWRTRRGFPCIEIDGFVRFDRESVEAWLAAHETRATA